MGHCADLITKYKGQKNLLRNQQNLECERDCWKYNPVSLTNKLQAYPHTLLKKTMIRNSTVY